MKNRPQLFFSLFMIFTMLFSGGSFVLAQDEASDDSKSKEVTLEEIVVTGSRIAREKGFGQTSPVMVMGKEDISSVGLTRIEDFLVTLPQVEAGQNAYLSNGATGTASLDLRGLGSIRTLTLMNGRRMQMGGTKTLSVDINQIPAAMVERVEVLTGGASAVYGADAVAGVANFIMRKVNGVELSIGGSATQHYNDNKYIQGLMDEMGYDYPTGSTGLDGKTYDIDLIAGGDFAGGRGNATVYASWRQNEELLEASRDYSSCALDSTGTYCGGSGTSPIPNFDIAPIDGEGEEDWGYEFWSTLQSDGSLAEFTDNYYNYAPINHYQRPDTRWSAGAFLDYEISDRAKAYMEVQYFTDHTRAQIAQSGTFFYGANFSIDPSTGNQYFTQAFRDSISAYYAGTPYENSDLFAIYIGKRNVEGGPRVEILDHTSFRIVSGLTGAINDKWNYDVSYVKAKTVSSSTYMNDFFEPKVATAVDSALCGADSDCIPYQVFTYNGVTAESAAALGGIAISANETTLEVVSATVNGDTGIGLPAGNIDLALGFEWREETYEDIRDYVYEQGLLLGQGGKIPSLAGDFSVSDIFAEMNIPLLADIPAIDQLILNLAYRNSHNTAIEDRANTYRVGLDWRTNDMLRFRANYNRAVRAPNVNELYATNAVGLWNGVDPCAGSSPVYSAAQCALTGVPEANYGTVSESPADQYYALFGGNQTLEPEKADTWTFGVVVEPVKNMKMSLDYWNIDIKDTIDTVGAELILELCAETGSLCDYIHRAPGNYSLWLTEDGYVEDTTKNVGAQNFEGIDFAAAYWMDALQGTFNFNIIGTYLLTKETTPIADDPTTTYDCVGLISSSCFPAPKWRHTASVTYHSQEAWSATLRWRFYSSVDYDGSTDQIVDLGATSYLDLNTVYKFGTNHDIIFGVNNVLDKEPPLMGSGLSGPWGNANTISGYYDMLGRYFFTKATFRF